MTAQSVNNGVITFSYTGLNFFEQVFLILSTGHVFVSTELSVIHQVKQVTKWKHLA